MPPNAREGEPLTVRQLALVDVAASRLGNPTREHEPGSPPCGENDSGGGYSAGVQRLTLWACCSSVYARETSWGTQVTILVNLFDRRWAERLIRPSTSAIRAWESRDGEPMVACVEPESADVSGKGWSRSARVYHSKR